MRRYYLSGLLMVAFMVALYAGIDPLRASNSKMQSEPQQKAGAAEAPQPGPSNLTVGAEPIIRAEKENACPDHQDDRQSELCAQWKAVDAARESLHIAWWSLGSTILLGAFSTILLIITLRETRQSSERQLRAYVSIGDGALHQFVQDDGSRVLEFIFRIENGGSTPAYECLHAGNVVVMDPVYAQEYFTKGWKKSPRLGMRPDYVIHAAGHADVAISSHAPISLEKLNALMAGNAALYAFGFVEYRDTFRKFRRTRFCRSIGADEFKRSDVLAQATPGAAQPVEWNVEPFHNDAT